MRCMTSTPTVFNAERRETWPAHMQKVLQWDTEADGEGYWSAYTFWAHDHDGENIQFWSDPLTGDTYDAEGGEVWLPAPPDYVAS